MKSINARNYSYIQTQNPPKPKKQKVGKQQLKNGQEETPEKTPKKRKIELLFLFLPIRISITLKKKVFPKPNRKENVRDQTTKTATTTKE